MSLKPPTAGNPGVDGNTGGYASGDVPVWNGSGFTHSAVVEVVREAPVNPLDPDFGAIGDLVADDTAALNAAFSHAKTALGGQGEVLLAKSFAVTAPLVVDGDNVSVRGIGRGTPNGAAAGSSNPVLGGPVIQPKASFAGSWVLDVAQQTSPTKALSGVDLRGFSIDGQNISGAIGGIHYQAQNADLEDVTVARIPGVGVYIEAVDHVTTFPKGAFDLTVRGLKIISKTIPNTQHALQISPGASDLIFENLIVRGVSSGFYGVYDQGSGNQYNGGIVELCQDYGFYVENARNFKLSGGLRVVECHGGVYLTAQADELDGAWSIVGVTFRNCSEGGDNLRDGIMVESAHVIRGGTIAGVDFSTVARNTSNGYRMRSGVNLANSNVQDVTIGPWSKSHTNPPATSCFGTAPVLDSGTRTRRLDREPAALVASRAQGLVGQNMDRQAVNNASVMIGGTEYEVMVALNEGDLISNVLAELNAAGSGTSLFKARILSADGTTEYARTADQSALMGTGGLKTLPLTAAWRVPATGVYYVSLVSTASTTLPSLWRGSNLTSASQIGTNPRPYATGGTGLTDLAAVPVTLAGGSPIAFWVGLT